MVELKIPVDVDFGLFSIRWMLPPMYKNAQVTPTRAMHGIAIHQLVIRAIPINTNTVSPIPILKFVMFLVVIFVPIKFIKMNADAVFATYTMDTSYSLAPSASVNTSGRIVHTAVAPVCLSKSDKNRCLFFAITFFCRSGFYLSWCHVIWKSCGHGKAYQKQASAYKKYSLLVVCYAGGDYSRKPAKRMK
jgi:hypothetical protein